MKKYHMDYLWKNVDSEGRGLLEKGSNSLTEALQSFYGTQQKHLRSTYGNRRSDNPWST